MIPTQTKLIGKEGDAFGLEHIKNKPRVSSMPYAWDIAEGNVPGHFSVNKFGHNSTVGAILEEVWDYSTAYTYLSSPSTLYISSGDNTDTQVYEVQGLDANWNYQTVTVSASGFTSVALPGEWIRVFRVKNLGATDNAGNIYISTDDDAGGDGIPDVASGIKAMITAGLNQTLMAMWSVPDAKTTAYLTKFYASTSSQKATEVHLYIRPFGGVFQIKKIITIFAGYSEITYDFPLKIPAKSDVAIKASTSGGGGEVSAGFDLWYED